MKKHFQYLKYLARHKWFVFVAGRKTKAPLWRLLIHDWSKFLPCEWFPYVAFFYGKTNQYSCKKEFHTNRCRGCIERKTVKNDFDRAWLHHQHANPHHWQHWILREDSGEVILLDIPQHFVREMVADWMGAGRAITGKWEAAAWYLKNREKIQLHYNARILVEVLLGVFGEVKAQSSNT